ncbi:hypothetical protein [Nocardia sp. NPDC057668]|uniref:hypothetical protein n=1 Tax=Nocardia sp. NPDC057668 TaxID=3346202 RepID=UPI003672B557
MTSDTGSELQKQVDKIFSKEPEFDSLDSKVDDKFNGLILAIKIGEVDPFGWRTAGLLEDNRDEIKKWVKHALYGDGEKPGIVDFLEGIDLPKTLVDVANSWRSIQGKIDNGTFHHNEANLTAQWQSPGHDSYEVTRQAQGRALAGASAVCLTIAQSLEDMAKQILVYYGELASAVVDLVVAIVTDLAGLASMKLFDGCDNIKDSVKNAANTIVTAINSTREVTQNIQINVNIINQNFTQPGLNATNDWPVPACAKFDDASIVTDENGLAGLPWSVKTDRASQPS